MITLTTEQAQQIEEALAFAASHSEYLADDLILYGEALATIRAARAQEQAEQEPVASSIRGFSLWLDREAWGHVIDGLMLERERSEQRKAANPESNSNYIANRCAELIAQIDEVATDIEQPVSQEPVAWYDKINGMEVSVDVSTGEDDDYHRIFGRVDGVMLQSCGAQEDTILVIEDSRNFDAPQPVKLEPIGEVDPYMDFLRINWKDDKHPPRGTKLYAAHFRTKDLTDDEIVEIMKQPFNQRKYLEQFARAVIAAYKEKNK